jgi:hypothetical protein
VLGLEDRADALVWRNHVNPAKRLLFASAMMRFVVDSDFLKLASSVAASSEVALWSVMSA